MPVLYSDVLMDHFRHPRNYGSLEAPDVSSEAFNPLCGDRIRIELKLDNETISEARFKDCDIRGIPARLIRRDPETQVVIRRENAMTGKWRGLDLSGTHWSVAIEWFLKSGDQDCVLAAPRRASNFTKLLDGLRKLRDIGVAEAD